VFEIDILNKLFHNIFDLFSNFHTNLLELFGEKVDVPIENPMPSRLKPFDPNATGSKESNKIFERFSKIINKPEEIPIQETIIEEKHTPFYENKYVIIGGILVLSCLAWYFYDDIKPLGSAVLARIIGNRSRPESGTDSSISSNTTFSNTDVQSLKNKLNKEHNKNENNESEVDQIDLIDEGKTNSIIQTSKEWINRKFIKKQNEKGKMVDFNNLSRSELERRGLDPDGVGLPPITGEKDNFVNEGMALLREMKALDKTLKTKDFTDIKVKEALFNLTKDRFHRFADANPELYRIYTQDDKINNQINDFYDLHKGILAEKLELVEVLKSPTYDEVALATTKERDHWSEPALSPKQDLLSPLKIPNEIKEDIYKIYSNKNPALELQIPTSTMEKILVGHEKATKESLDSTNTAKEIPINKEELSENRFSKVNDILNKAETNEVKVDENIKIVDWNDDIEEDLDNYFPKADEVGVAYKEITDQKGKSKLIETEIIRDEDSIQPVKNERKSLFDMIKAKRNDKDVVSSPNIGNNNIPSTSNISDVGLQTSIVEKINPSPIVAKPSISNLLESFNDLYDDNGIDIEDNSNLQQGESSNTKIEDVKPIRPDVSALLKEIKSKRLEYGSPGKIDKELPEDNIEDYGEDQEEVEEEIGPINWKDEIKFNINRGDIKDRFIDFNFGDKFKDINKIYIFLNDGSAQYIDVHANISNIQSIKLDNKGISNPDHKELDIFKIFVMDNIKPKLSQEIYANPNVNILKSFHENRVGRNY
jgi:hypothetical protein